MATRSAEVALALFLWERNRSLLAFHSPEVALFHFHVALGSLSSSLAQPFLPSPFSASGTPVHSPSFHSDPLLCRAGEGLVSEATGMVHQGPQAEDEPVAVGKGVEPGAKGTPVEHPGAEGTPGAQPDADAVDIEQAGEVEPEVQSRAEAAVVEQAVEVEPEVELQAEAGEVEQEVEPQAEAGEVEQEVEPWAGPVSIDVAVGEG